MGRYSLLRDMSSTNSIITHVYISLMSKTRNALHQDGSGRYSPRSVRSETLSQTDVSCSALESPWTEGRRSRSLDTLPNDIQDHIRRCQCPCDHLGYGNTQVSASLFCIIK